MNSFELSLKRGHITSYNRDVLLIFPKVWPALNKWLCSRKNLSTSSPMAYKFHPFDLWTISSQRQISHSPMLLSYNMFQHNIWDHFDLRPNFAMKNKCNTNVSWSMEFEQYKQLDKYQADLTLASSSISELPTGDITNLVDFIMLCTLLATIIYIPGTSSHMVFE